MVRKSLKSFRMLISFTAYKYIFQWRVRRTVASSLYEIAVIEGEHITHRDLLPVFDALLRDIDEVRIGVLLHLSDFLKVG